MSEARRSPAGNHIDGNPGLELEQHLRQVADDFAAAWNKHDPTAMAYFWSADGDLINPSGRKAKGLTEIQRLFQDEQNGAMKNSTFTITSFSMRYLDSTYASVDADAEISGVATPDGSIITIKAHVFNVMRKTSDHKDNSVVAAAKDSLRLDAEPLRPCDANEIRREARARNLPVAFDRNAGGALACRSCALNDKIVCKPAQVASLPLQAIDFAEIHAERVGSRQEIEKKARANAVLIAEAGSGSELDRGLFPYN